MEINAWTAWLYIDPIAYTCCNYPNKNINKYALEKARLPRSVFFVCLQAPSGSAILNLQRGSHDISPVTKLDSLEKKGIPLILSTTFFFGGGGG